MTKQLENICRWLTIATEQRKHEIERGEGINGTQTYQERGCYDCNGLNRTCEYYLNLYELINK